MVNSVNTVIAELTWLARGIVVDMGKLDPDDSRPPYQQIADALRAEIESGDLAPGAQLPVLSVLSSEYEVAPGTVKSAIAVLRDAGLVVTRQGKGSYVRTRAASGQSDGSELAELRHGLEALTERVADLEKRLAER